jgi:hypothetical protein
MWKSKEEMRGSGERVKNDGRKEGKEGSLWQAHLAVSTSSLRFLRLIFFARPV